jgi:phenylacetate-CoA ligase
MRAHLHAIQRLNPEVIAGYGSLVGHLGHFLDTHQIDLGLPALRLLTYTSDAMLPHFQAAAERALGAPVASEYACREFGLIAFQCPAGGLHLAEDTLWLEVVDDAGRPVPDGEPGRVLLTDLRPSRTPYIRYALDDVATLAPRDARCPCGVTLRRMDGLVGRTSEMVPRLDGTWLHASVLDGLVKLLPGIGHWQTHFAPPNRLRILVEMRPEALAPWREGLLERMRAYAGPGMVCEVETVEAIAPQPSGKYVRLVIEPGEEPAVAEHG